MGMDVECRVKDLRSRSGASQAELALMCGVPRKRLGRIERGERECTLGEALAICAALNCSVEDAFKRTGTVRNGVAADLAGARFGRLKVLSRAHGTHEHKGETFWLCRCECGNDTIVRSDHLLSGHTTSCGCRVPANFQLAHSNDYALYPKGTR